MWGRKVGDLVAKGIEKVNALFPLDFTVRLDTSAIQGSEIRGKAQSKEDVLLVREDWVREHLNKPDTLESMGAGRVHSQALRELADKLWGCSWKPLKGHGFLERSGRNNMSLPVFRKEDLGNYRPVSPTWIPGKMMEKLIQEIVSKHMKNN